MEGYLLGCSTLLIFQRSPPGSLTKADCLEGSKKYVHKNSSSLWEHIRNGCDIFLIEESQKLGNTRKASQIQKLKSLQKAHEF